MKPLDVASLVGFLFLNNIQMKLTKRKGFNFFRSYYDVFNELPEKDKLPFIEALLDRQFLGVQPKGLKGLAKFAWISQVNSIDSQVKGFEDKTGIKLTPTEGGSNTPTEQVEGEVQVEEKVQDVPTFTDKKKGFILWFNQSKFKYTGKQGKSKVLTKTDESNLKKLIDSYEQSDFDIAIKNLYNSKWAQENNMRTISHFVRIENFNKYLEQGDTVSEYKNVNNQPAN